jgi:hypothetical protein
MEASFQVAAVRPLDRGGVGVANLLDWSQGKLVRAGLCPLSRGHEALHSWAWSIARLMHA